MFGFSGETFKTFANLTNISDQRDLLFCLIQLLLILILIVTVFDTFCAPSARMDPALLRERELFKKRALSTPAVEKRQAASDSGSHKKKKPKVDKESSSGSKHSAGK